MKTKLLLIVLLALTACKDDETPTPEPVKPVVPTTDYYVQVTATKIEHATMTIPRFAYFTDKEYIITWHKDTAWPATKTNVEYFKDSIELYVAGEFLNEYALNIYYKDSLLATDTVDNHNFKKRVKWRL